MLKCDRCHNEITLGQWATDWCPSKRYVLYGQTFRHTITRVSPAVGERKLREAYRAEQMQASYGRTQG